MAIEAGASIVIVGEHPDNGKFYKIGEVRQDGWILTTDNRLFHHQFFEVCSPLEPRPRASKTPKRAKRSTTLSSPSSNSIPFKIPSLGNTDVSLTGTELSSNKGLVVGSPNESEELPRSSSSKLTTIPDTLQGEALSDKQRSHSQESSISITSNSFLGESESPIFLGENLGDRTSEISPKKKTVNPVTSSEIFLGENLGQNDRTSEISPKKNPSGSLYAFIQDKKDKHGNVKTYPKVEGDRSTGNPDHWFWAYCWDEKVNGRWKTFKRSVPREKLSKVRMAINANQPVSEILKIIG